jgi:hypothetical protein
MREPGVVGLSAVLLLGAVGCTVAPANAERVSQGTQAATGDSYDDEFSECAYITQCSSTAANASTASIPNSAPGYGALNDWRIGNGEADSVDPGTSAIGAIGLLYGYARLSAAGRSNGTLDANAKTALSGYFWSWVRNPQNQVDGSSGGVTRIGFATTESFDTGGNRTAIGTGSAAATAEVLIAMRKYCQLSPNGDGGNYQSQEYSLAHQMADYINANVNSWTLDRSYAVAAFLGFSHWAMAVGDSGTASYYAGQANTLSGELAAAQDQGAWGNYYDYLDGNDDGVYNGGVDQTGFAPYELDARDPGEAYAKKLADWWNYGQAYNGAALTVQSGPYAGGVHQWTPQSGTDNQVYPGSAFQLADAEWKIARATGNYNDEYGSAWSHYDFAMTPVGSGSGAGCWVTAASEDPSGFVGGFIDWVDTGSGNRPADWQRFVDTSAYMIVATEELVFSSLVDFSQ